MPNAAGGYVLTYQNSATLAAVAAALVLQPSSAVAQAEPGAPSAALPLASPAAAVPAGTSVTLRLKQPVSSRTAKRGDLFEVELVNDIYVEASTVIPAGTKGMAQVVHSSPKGFGGRAGELIVAARYLESRGRRLPLRKTKFSSAGSDNAGAAIATSIAAPVVGLFVTGTSVDLPQGSIIVAETSESFAIDG